MEKQVRAVFKLGHSRSRSFLVSHTPGVAQPRSLLSSLARNLPASPLQPPASFLVCISSPAPLSQLGEQMSNRRVLSSNQQPFRPQQAPAAPSNNTSSFDCPVESHRTTSRKDAELMIHTDVEDSSP